MASCIDLGALTSPAWAPVRVSVGAVEGASLDEDAYRRASFLDDRVLEDRAVSLASWADLSASAPPVRATHFIFHVGHCGSSLLSRLLGEHPALFSLREPALLRDLAQGRLPEDALEVLLGLYGRVWQPGQTALIKATSFVSEIGPALMARAGGRALLLGVTPPAYLRGILAGPNSRQEARALADARKARLERRFGRGFRAHGEGEAIALAWLCETAALQALADAYPQACLRLDFERGLANPAAWLVEALRHLQVEPQALDLQALIDGPLMRRYAKGPEHAYDADLRAAVLAKAARDHADTVRAGMDWLQRAARADARVARILTVSAEVARAPFAASGRAG
jgi:hypothetical protein